MHAMFIDPTTGIKADEHPLVMLAALYQVKAALMARLVTVEEGTAMFRRVCDAASERGCFQAVWRAFSADAMEVEGYPAPSKSA